MMTDAPFLTADCWSWPDNRPQFRSQRDNNESLLRISLVPLISFYRSPSLWLSLSFFPSFIRLDLKNAVSVRPPVGHMKIEDNGRDARFSGATSSWPSWYFCQEAASKPRTKNSPEVKALWCDRCAKSDTASQVPGCRSIHRSIRKRRINGCSVQVSWESWGYGGESFFRIMTQQLAWLPHTLASAELWRTLEKAHLFHIIRITQFSALFRRLQGMIMN